MKVKIHPALASFLCVSVYIAILFLVSGCIAQEDKQPVSTDEVLDHDSGKTDAEVTKQWTFERIGEFGGRSVYLATDPLTQCQYVMYWQGGITPRNYSDQVQVCGDPAYDGELHPNIQTDNFPTK
jgi:hypothetical protein